MADDFSKAQPSASGSCAGRPASLTVSETITLAIFSQWYIFRTQRDFYRYAQRNLKSAFPRLPDRTQYNRLVRQHRDQIVAFIHHLVDCLQARNSPYEVLDTTGVPVRNDKRGGYGWLGGFANIGWCTRLRWYDGFRLLISVNAKGTITGFGFGTGSAKEQPLTDAFMALRAHPDPRFLSVGQPAQHEYLADKGFAGYKTHQHWFAWYNTRMICEPQTNCVPWPVPWQRWLHSLRQIVETTFDKLINFFGLQSSRPHDITGFQAGLAAKIALHNFCMWLNLQYGRHLLAFADLLDW